MWLPRQYDIYNQKDALAPVGKIKMAGHDSNELANALTRNSNGAPPPPGALQYPVTQNLWFNQKIVKLDGWSFESCRFDGCRLVIETPYFRLQNCYIDDSTEIELKGSIVNAVKLLNLSSKTARHPAFCAVRNLDGTISIG
ncbi:hypothetical protein D3C77_408220 [compost metagenome]